MIEKQSGRHATVPAALTPSPFPDEIEHLKWMNGKLDSAVQAANANVQQIDKEYRDAKRYMAEYRGEIDPHEMFQNELALGEIDKTGAFAVGIREKLEKLRESPYFARIDFQKTGETQAEKHYIGRFAFSHEDELLILDWRSPLAGMFYDCETGPAGYNAPVGRIEGELVRKRQFQVKNGVLEYALESAVNIQDNVLQRELSHTSDEKMKSIIATIQKEQNQIIRNEKSGTMLIQGVAGSGKTSIALHRIAYLLYRFQDRLNARNIVILSPNRVFGDYISTVLPELGEEPIAELSFRDIAEVQLEGIIGFEPDKDPLETQDAGWAERVRFKSTLDFVKQMELYLQEAPSLIFAPTDYSVGHFTVTADWLKNRFCTYQSDSVKKRLERIADDIHSRFTSESYLEEETPRARAILKNLTAMLKIKNTLALYRHFYQWLKRPDLLVMPQRKTLEWADVFPFLYLHGAFEGVKTSKLIKHLVIDEMQDYTPTQYAVINRLFPCQKTILGDFGQLINSNHPHTLADMQELYCDASLVELCKSYRSTYEIITFAKGIGRIDKLEPMERHGDAPTVFPCMDWPEEFARLEALLNAFFESGSVSLGIIMKTDSAARALYELLVATHEVRLISSESTHFENGVSITSVKMSKGLEFDEVIIPDADSGTYRTEYDRSLLYIACTRAMHRLTLLYTGEQTRLIGG